VPSKTEALTGYIVSIPFEIATSINSTLYSTLFYCSTISRLFSV